MASSIPQWWQSQLRRVRGTWAKSGRGWFGNLWGLKRQRPMGKSSLEQPGWVDLNSFLMSYQRPTHRPPLPWPPLLLLDGVLVARATGSETLLTNPTLRPARPRQGRGSMEGAGGAAVCWGLGGGRGEQAQSQLVPASSCTLSVPGSGSADVAGMLNSSKGRGLADGGLACPMPPPFSS